ncbi:MAG: NfeD family protein [Microcoleus sp.]
MSTNYVEEASFADENLPTIVDRELRNVAAEKTVEIAPVGSEEISGDAVTPQPSTHHTSHPIAQDEKAIVEEEIRPGETGRVRYQSSWWPARSEQEIIFNPGEAVRVIAIDNITLIVEAG